MHILQFLTFHISKFDKGANFRNVQTLRMHKFYKRTNLKIVAISQIWKFYEFCKCAIITNVQILPMCNYYSFANFTNAQLLPTCKFYRVHWRNPLRESGPDRALLPECPSWSWSSEPWLYSPCCCCPSGVKCIRNLHVSWCKPDNFLWPTLQLDLHVKLKDWIDPRNFRRFTK